MASALRYAALCVLTAFVVWVIFSDGATVLGDVMAGVG